MGKRRKEEEIIKILREADVKEYAVEFIREDDEARNDLIADQEAKDKTPLDYRFEVFTNTCKPNNESDTLNLTSDITFEIRNEEGNEYTEEVEVPCIQADGKELSCTTSDNSATFNAVLLGPLEVHVSPVTDSDESNDNGEPIEP